MSLDSALPVIRIVSGGQTGADRAALDWAIQNCAPHGGWCPAGRRAEDGSIPPQYDLIEAPVDAYAVRTKWNVRDSDGTVIFSLGETLTGGSRLTADFARELQKPWLHLSRSVTPDPSMALRRFVDQNFVQVLNVAGPRASTEPGIEAFVSEILSDALLS